ncbi:MAG: hypothetical protein QM504_11875 [Pseudomonadota bacterium]
MITIKKLFALIISFNLYGCAFTEYTVSAVENPRYEGYAINNLITSFYDKNNDINICLNGHKLVGRSRIPTRYNTSNTSLEKQYITKIEGHKLNNTRKQLKFLNIYEKDCGPFKKGNKRNTTDLPIFVASTFKSRKNDSCLIKWEKQNYKAESIRIGTKNNCSLNESSDMHQLKEALIKKKSYSNGIYIINGYLLDRYNTMGYQARIHHMHLKQDDGVFNLKLPITKNGPYPIAAILIPFALVLDIVTSPIQLIACLPECISLKQ